MKINNLDKLIFAVNYCDMDKFHMFMRDFKTKKDVFNKYVDILCEKIILNKDFLDGFDFFVFVPSNNLQRINFSMKIARILSQKLGKFLNEKLLQKIKVIKELKTLPEKERYKEIKNSFTASLKGGERICIVDDVTASGATLSEISKILKYAGASCIYAAVIVSYDMQK
ncbi:MAG: hypothetical protein LBD46_05665 [Endomicrobium sp.]|jgi:predicted amidophosphoribosyltransferase|nr:hypothetical protein [Endomicrobium sp.]